MRNILQYPMTIEEAISILEGFKESCDPRLVGDIRPYALDWIMEKLLEYKEMTNGTKN